MPNSRCCWVRRAPHAEETRMIAASIAANRTLIFGAFPSSPELPLLTPPSPALTHSGPGLRPGPPRVGIGLPREPEDPLSDHVPQHLGGAAADRERRAEQEALRPPSAVRSHGAGVRQH